MCPGALAVPTCGWEAVGGEGSLVCPVGLAVPSLLVVGRQWEVNPVIQEVYGCSHLHADMAIPHLT